MFESIFQSLTALLLGGVFCYAIFVSERLKNLKKTKQALIGLVFGILVVSLSLNAYLVPPRGVPLDANAGPLVLAGYLGGLIGWLIVMSISAMVSVNNSGPISGLGVFVFVAIPTVGFVVGLLRPPKVWPIVPRTAIGYMLSGFLPIFVVTTVVAGSSIPTDDGYWISGMIAVMIAAVGVVSIIVTWQIISYAAKFASEASRSLELAKRLGITLKHSGLGVFERDVDSADVYFDAVNFSIYGMDREAGLLSKSEWMSMINPEDHPAVLNQMKFANSGEQDHGWVDFRINRPDGELRYIRGYWSADRDRSGGVKRIIGLHADLTEIRLAEQEHLKSVDRLALVAENLPGVVFQVDVTDWENRAVTYMSPKCEQFWGYSREELYADNSLISAGVDPENMPEIQASLRAAAKSGDPITFRTKVTARGGQTRWVDYHGGISKSGGRVMMEGIILDVTGEVAVQEQIDKERQISFRAQKSESIGQLTGGVAHDFNNLLAVILGNLELLSDQTDPASHKDLIDAAIAATLRGADLTKNMLAFARKARLTPEVLDLNDVVRESKNWMGRTLPESVSIEASLLAGLWPVEVDRSSLESALLNLILNARDAMDGKGSLTIETANIRIDDAYVDSRQEEISPGRYVMLAVSDTGDGIEDEDLASIFEPFFTTKPPGAGSGLGLSMTFGFMRQSGGTVQVYTELGKGTTFKLYFPASDGSKGQQELQIHNKDKGLFGGRRILVAEDEAEVRHVLEATLEGAGYVVTGSSSGDEALAIFEADPTYDLLLTDIVMPGELQGTQLAKAIRQRWTDLPIIFMSGYASEATVHGNGLRADDIRLMKPVQRADLLEALAKALRKSDT